MTEQISDGSSHPPSTAVLVVSVWFETPDASGFRARLTSHQPDGSVRAWGVAAAPDAVILLTRSWLASAAPS